MYEPVPADYENAAGRVGVSLDRCRLVSSYAWVVVGASNAGMMTAWINMAREPAERVGGSASMTGRTLSELATSLID